jgi:hypothetical protein
VIAHKIIKALLGPLGLELRRKSFDATPAERAAIERFSRYSMCPQARLLSLLRAIEYVDANGIPGDIVECGVWRGGNMMLAAAVTDRKIWLYDTFAGMTRPTEHDISSDGRSARAIQAAHQRKDHNAWAYASIDEVKANFRREGLLSDRLVFRKGMVEETLAADPRPEQISILRLDTDWYESTLVELQTLYPRLSGGGVLIIDDYGTWLGAKRAFDEYFGAARPLLFPVEGGCKMAIKPLAAEGSERYRTAPARSVG